MNDRLSKAEINKDAFQETVEAAATAVGQVTSIITGAVRDVTKAIGGFASDTFEIRDGARRAKEQLSGESVPDPGPEPEPEPEAGSGSPAE